MKAQIELKTTFLIFVLLLSTSFVSSVRAEETSNAVTEKPVDTAAAAAATPTESPVPGIAPPVEAVPEPLQVEEPETNPQFRPEVIISKVGEELNLKVKYVHPMDFKNDDAIEYIRMETLTGEFLGLMTFNDKFTEATAEFMINPTLANFNQVRLVAKSTKVGLVKSIHKLEVTPVTLPPTPEVTPTEQMPVKSTAADKPRKRILGLF